MLSNFCHGMPGMIVTQWIFLPKWELKPQGMKVTALRT